MALYLGDTEVAPVIEVPVPEKRFSVGINNFLGTVDENGVYIQPTERFTPDFSNVKGSLPVFSLRYAFYENQLVSGAVVFGFENIEQNGMTSTFKGCLGITSVSFPALTTISGAYAMASTFQSCGNLTSVSFPALTTISGGAAMSNAFQSCGNLTNLSFPALTTISGNGAMNSAFGSCSKLTSLSFPALTTVAISAFGTASYAYAFSYCTALTEIHFRADAQAAIEAVTGYAAKWGATNATIYFDL